MEFHNLSEPINITFTIPINEKDIPHIKCLLWHRNMWSPIEMKILNDSNKTLIIC